jgi:hypothetical protein
LFEADRLLPDSQSRVRQSDLDRLDRLRALSPTASDRTALLCDLALRGLSQMYSGSGAFVQTMRGVATGSGMTARPEGDSLRYAAIVSLGLACAEEGAQRRVLKGETAADLAATCARRATSASDLGAIAISAWAAAEIAGTFPADLLARLAALLEDGRPVETLACAWALTAALAAQHLGDTALLKQKAATRLRSGQAKSGLFPHTLPGQGWARAHIGSFADQVYPIQALARLSVADADLAALEAAEACAAQICALQGHAGQWWWHYDTRDASVAEGYPVYSVHQHAMAPMALLELAEAGGQSRWDAIIRGLGWLDDPPEAPVSLVSDADSIIWRKIGRGDPAKAVRSVSALTTALKPGWHLPGLDLAFPPDRVDYECRPYEFGWLLYAWCSGGVVEQLRPAPDGPHA